MIIAPRNTIDTLKKFTPALSNLWNFKFEINNKSGLTDDAVTFINNLKYLLTSVEIEGWAFKYDYIPAYQQNVLVGVNRPTKIILNFMDMYNFGIMDSFVTLITTKLFRRTSSTFRINEEGKNIGSFIIDIMNPYYNDHFIEEEEENRYSPFSASVSDENFVSLKITCKNVHLNSSPPLSLSRTESKPITHSIEFQCDTIEYVSNKNSSIDIPKEQTKKDLDSGQSGIVSSALQQTVAEQDSPVSSTGDFGKQEKSPTNNFAVFKKYLSVTTPSFTNLFYVDFNFGDKVDLGGLEAYLKTDKVFNDILIESVTIDGYHIDYDFSESLIKNLITKIHRPLTISFSIVDNNRLSFLTALNLIIRKYYYNDTYGFFVNEATGKNMWATFVLYTPDSQNSTKVQYLIHAEGMKILKMPSLNLNYNNSDAIRYNVEMTCDSISFLNKAEIENSTFNLFKKSPAFRQGFTNNL